MPSLIHVPRQQVLGPLTPAGQRPGTAVEVSAGDFVVLPRGWSGRWDVTETLRKTYSIF